MSSKKKKVLSALLASSMVVAQYSVVGMVVQAEENTTTVSVSNSADLQSALSNTSVTKIQLTSDIKLEKGFTISRNLTLDLNKQKITVTNDSGHALTVTNGAEVTILSTGDSGNENDVGAIIKTNDHVGTQGSNIAQGYVLYVANGTVTMKSGRIEQHNDGSYAVSVGSSGYQSTFNLEGGVIVDPGPGKGCVMVQDYGGGSTFNMSGGVLNAKTTENTGIATGLVVETPNTEGEQKIHIALANFGTSTISGGTINGIIWAEPQPSLKCANPTVTIKGNATVNGDLLTTSGYQSADGVTQKIVVEGGKLNLTAIQTTKASGKAEPGSIEIKGGTFEISNWNEDSDKCRTTVAANCTANITLKTSTEYALGVNLPAGTYKLSNAEGTLTVEKDDSSTTKTVTDSDNNTILSKTTDSNNSVSTVLSEVAFTLNGLGNNDVAKFGDAIPTTANTDETLTKGYYSVNSLKWTKGNETAETSDTTFGAGSYKATVVLKTSDDLNVTATAGTITFDSLKNDDTNETGLTIPTGWTAELAEDKKTVTLTRTFEIGYTLSAPANDANYTLSVTKSESTESTKVERETTVQKGDTITVTPNTGYKIGSAKVGDASMTQTDDGSYTYTVQGSEELADLAPTVSALELISEVKITDPTLKPGETLPKTLTIDNEKVTAEIAWSSAEKVEYGTEYTATVTLTANTGYAFADSLTVSEGWAKDNNGNYTKTFIINEGEISSIKLPSVTAPVYGEDLPEITIPTVENYTETAEWTLNGEKATGKVGAGEYVLTVTVKPNEGYKFADGITVNSAWAGDTTKGYTQTFTVKEPDKAIDSVDLSAVINDDLTFGVTASAKSGTTTVASGTFVIKDSDGKEVEKAENGKTYTVEVTFKAVDGYAYDEKLAADGWTKTVNDDKSLTFKTELTAPEAEIVKVKVTIPENVTVTDNTGAALKDGDEVAEGTILTITATAPSGKTLKSLTVNGETFTSGMSYTVGTEPVVIAVEFKSKSSGSSASHSSSGRRHTTSSSTTTTTTTTEPATSDGVSGWTAIASKLNAMTEGGSASIDLNGTTAVPADVVKAIANKKLKVTFKKDGVYSWTIDGSKVSNATAADLTVVRTSANKPSDLRGTLGTSFKVNGTDVPATLNISFKASHAGEFANLYVKGTDGKYTFVDTVKVDANGTASGLDADAKGEYIVMLGAYSDLNGDANNDGNLNALDASAVLKDIVGLETAANSVMEDYDGSGTVNALDAAAILKFIVGMN